MDKINFDITLQAEYDEHKDRWNCPASTVKILLCMGDASSVVHTKVFTYKGESRQEKEHMIWMAVQEYLTKKED